eukprot:3061811-Pyramimonas_sp.AAC.1
MKRECASGLARSDTWSCETYPGRRAACCQVQRWRLSRKCQDGTCAMCFRTELLIEIGRKTRWGMQLDGSDAV